MGRRYAVAGLTLFALAVGALGAGALAAPPASSSPTETIAFGPLWQAARQAETSPAGADALRLPALRRWAKSPEADRDLLTATEMSIERNGRFTQTVLGPGITAFLVDAAAARGDAVARAILVSLVAQGVRAADLPRAALRLFPGPSGLEALLPSPVDDEYNPEAAALITAYGLGGAAGLAYVRAHPADVNIIAAMAGARSQDHAAMLQLWHALPTPAAQLALVTAQPYVSGTDATAMLPDATPAAAQVLDMDALQALPYGAPAAKARGLVAAIARSTDRIGVVHTQYGMSAPLTQAIALADPHGLVARSIAAYDQVRGEPYFGLARCHGNYSCWPYVYGAAQYRPSHGVAAWPGFLRAFADAPGANDAAYRLGRDEELRGQYAQAVLEFVRAQSLPDGDMAWAAGQREVWVLDTEMTARSLAAMLRDPLPADVRLAVRYSLGVDQMRAGDYAAAQATLDAVAAAVGTRSLVPLPGDPSWPFAAAVRVQAMEAGDLARLERAVTSAPTTQVRATARYALAAYLYHRTLVFYNQLWGGTLGSYPFEGNQPFAPTASTVAFVEGENNFVQAGRRFSALAADPATPAAIRSRALFSYGMCLYSLESYNASASVLWPSATLRQAVADVFTAFGNRYPQSPLAPEALTLRAAFTSSRDVLRLLWHRYPHSAQGADAGADLVQKAWPTLPPAPTGVMPATAILATTVGVPAAVRAWAASPGPAVAARVVGASTYIRVRPAHLRYGPYPTVVTVLEVAPGQVTVMYGTGPAAVGVARPVPLTRGYALVRVHGAVRVAGSQTAPYAVPASGSYLGD